MKTGWVVINDRAGVSSADYVVGGMNATSVRETFAEACEFKNNILDANSEELLCQVYGENYSLKVRQVELYECGDPKPNAFFPL